MKKKLLFIDHEFHRKTKSSIFMQKILSKQFDIELFYYDPYNKNDKNDKFSHIKGNTYDAVVCWQIMPSINMLKKYISFEHGVFFPMYDGVPSISSEIWLEYKDFNIINFSKTLHNELKQIGFSSYYIQYFPKPYPIKDFGNENSIFFWQRRNEININLIEKLVDMKKIKHIHIHKAVDPLNNFIEPQNKELEKKITYSEWFDKREDMQSKMLESAIYIAPRNLEGIGMSFLEAMSMGRCVISTNLPTMNEYIEDGETGLLYDLDNPKELDLSNIREIQKNTQEYIKNGYNKWLDNSKKINSWIIAKPKKSEDLLQKYEKELQKNCRTIYFLGLIPLIKIKKSETKIKYYFCGIPFIKVKQKSNSKKISLMGIHIYTIKKHFTTSIKQRSEFI